MSVDPRQPPGQPVVRQTHRGRRIGMSGFLVGEPAQLGDRDGGDRHHTDPLRPFLGATQLRNELGRGGTGSSVVPQQCISHDIARLVQAHHAVLLCSHRHRVDVVESTGGADGGLQSGPPQLRVDLGAVGMRRRRGAHGFAGVGVADHHLAGLGGRVDSRNESHVHQPS